MVTTQLSSTTVRHLKMADAFLPPHASTRSGSLTLARAIYQLTPLGRQMIRISQEWVMDLRLTSNENQSVKGQGESNFLLSLLPTTSFVTVFLLRGHQLSLKETP